jgi:signal transduction histidine kinase/ABC-type uncharacterized transport system substrate-binding protein
VHLFLLAFVSFLLFNSLTYGNELREEKRVLILFTAQSDLPAYPMVVKGVKSSLQAGTEFHIEYFIQYMDYYRNPDPADAQLLLDLYHRKFSREKIDLVIAYSSAALNLVVTHSNDLFPQTPVVFSGILREQLKVLHLNPMVTGVLVDIDYAGLLETALKIHPQTRHVAIVNGASKTDLFLEKEFRQALEPYAKRLDFIYLTRLPMGKILERVQNLPEHSVVLFYFLTQDGEGKGFVSAEAASMVAEAANAPVYGCLDSYFGHGIVGGRMTSMEMTGVKAGEMALRILKGEKPSDNPMTSQGTIIDLFDWRQFKRFKIREERLPPGSIVRFKEFSIWEQYKWYILGLTIFCLVEFLLLVGLLIQRRRRSRAEQKMAESEAKFAAIYQNTPVPMFLLDESRRVRETNRAAQEAVTLLAPEIKGLGFGNAFRCIHSLDNPNGCGFGPSCEDCPVRRIILNTFQTGRSHHQVEVKLTSGAGLERNDNYFLLSTTLPDISQDRLVLLHIEDITNRRYAELEAQRHRDELAVMSRRATLGELIASIAHELKQPLAAILSNTQAALRFLSKDAPDLNEVHDILQDIVRDDKRASGVLQRLHVPLRKSEPVFRTLDLNEIILEVIALLKNEMDLKGVSLVMALAEGLPPVRGDIIQLQQVALNLILNGAEAMMDLDHDFRRIIISTEKHDEQTLEVSVRDSGRGLYEDNIDQIFDPFYTTKPQGMGMGLSISRSIVEAHGGRMWSANNPDRGATFSFTVPVFEQMD